MLERKDPAIKLFGKTIPLPVEQEFLANEPPRGGGGGAESESSLVDFCNQNPVCSTTCLHEENSNVVVVVDGEEEEEEQKKPSGDEVREGKQEDNSAHQISEDLKDPTTSSGICEVRRTPSIDKEASSLKSSENGDQTETSSQEKCLKKPDKILPCPRCNSMDTKFCYFNNYNVNQPRHFCKHCQRYWTAGGTMRNVPVGAGRRKNKNSSAHYRHILVSDALQAARANAANGLHNPSLGSNGTVLTFGSDSPLCESMNSVLNLAERSQKCVRNGIHGPEQRIFVSCGGGDNGDDHSTGSTITATNSSEKGGNASLQESMINNFQGFPPQVPSFPVSPWPYPWNSATPPPAFCPPSFPVSFYPAPTYWGCTVPGSWNIPCLSPQPSPFNHCTPRPGPNSPSLGKHSRDGDLLYPVNSKKEEALNANKDSERCVWIPKTLRIDDPSEAAKSSVWATLGIKNEKTNSESGGGLFKAFQSKGNHKNHVIETSAVLQANPAALSRSLNFQEST